METAPVSACCCSWQRPPVVAAGGAIFGAAAADSSADVSRYTAVLDAAFQASGQIYATQLAQQLQDMPNISLHTAGAAAHPNTTQLHVAFQRLTGHASGVRSDLTISLAAQTRLFFEGESEPTFTRHYVFTTQTKTLAAWTEDGPAPLTHAIEGLAARTVSSILADHFLTPAYAVTAKSPARNQRRLKSLRPSFAWQLLDAGQPSSAGGVAYELELVGGAAHPVRHTGILTASFTPPAPLAACTEFKWRVRGAYESLGLRRETEWSKARKFRTPCPER